MEYFSSSWFRVSCYLLIEMVGDDSSSRRLELSHPLARLEAPWVEPGQMRTYKVGLFELDLDPRSSTRSEPIAYWPSSSSKSKNFQTRLELEFYPRSKTTSRPFSVLSWIPSCTCLYGILVEQTHSLSFKNAYLHFLQTTNARDLLNGL